MTAEVSDKHLEDQSRDVSALAISTATFCVNAGSLSTVPCDTGGSPIPVCGTGGPCTVFVSTTTTDGNIPGIAGADAICQADAASAGLTGTFLAWISDSSGASPSTRFTQSTGPYVLRSGTEIASSYADLIAGDMIANPINQNASGGASGLFVWTGTRTNGAPSIFATSFCNDWTNSTSGFGGVSGSTSASNSDWTGENAAGGANRASLCTLNRNVYCFEQ